MDRFSTYRTCCSFHFIFYFAPTSILQRKYNELNLIQMEMVLRWKKNGMCNILWNCLLGFFFIYGTTTKLMETLDARSASIYNTTFLNLFFDAFWEFLKKPYQWKYQKFYLFRHISIPKNILRFLSQNFAIHSYFFLYKTYILQIMNYNAVTTKYWLTHFNLQVFINLIVFIAARVFFLNMQYDRKKSEWFFYIQLFNALFTYSLSFIHK